MFTGLVVIGRLNRVQYRQIGEARAPYNSTMTILDNIEKIRLGEVSQWMDTVPVSALSR